MYQEYYQTHQLISESASAVSWVGSLQAFFLFAGALVGGPLFDRYGEKVLLFSFLLLISSTYPIRFTYQSEPSTDTASQVIWPTAFLYIFSLFMTSLCTRYWQFMLAQGILGGISMGMTMAPSMAATPQYFNKKRGAAMGIAVAGSSLGGVLLPIMLGKMLNGSSLSFGWSVRVVAFILLVVLGSSCLCIKARLPPRKGRFLLLEAFKDRQYLAVIAASFFMVLGVFVPMFFLPSYAVKNGMGTLLSSYLLSILNAASLFGRVIPGIMADRLGRYNVFSTAGISTGILIFCWPRITSNAGIIVFASLFGFCSGAIVSGMTVCFATCTKDPRNIGTYMGMGMTVASIAGLIGSPINGVLIERYGGLYEVSWFTGSVVLAGSAMAVLAKWLAGEGLFAKI